VRGLSALKEMSQAFGKAGDLAEALDVLLDRMLVEMGAVEAAVLLVEPETRTWRMAAGRGISQAQIHAFNGRKLPIDGSFLGTALQACEILEVTDSQLPAGLFGDQEAREVPFTTVPLISRNEPVGILVIQARPQDDELYRLLEALVYIAGDAIEHASLSETQQHHRLLLETIRQFSKRITSIFELDEWLPYAVELICNNFNYSSVSLYLRNNGNLVIYRADHEKNSPVVSTLSPAELDTDFPVAHVIATGELVWIEDSEAEETFSVKHMKPRSHSEFAAPLSSMLNSNLPFNLWPIR